ncbi:MAG: galactokinase [Bacteroidota bacterium]
MNEKIYTTSRPELDLTREQLEEQTVQLFQERFQSPPTHIASAPGRVNLIGEHTDYNEGYVLPLAVDRHTAVAAGARGDRVLRAFSQNLQSSFRAPVDDLIPKKRPAWSNYVKGIAILLQRSGATLSGANLCINGTIPRGAGLSSSAALEVATAHALRALNNLSHTDEDLIHLCQKAEHEFAGVLCGIMDQYVTTLARSGTALFLDCRTLEVEQIPFPPGIRLLVIDTGVRRRLSSSEYNTRRGECAAAVGELQKVLPEIRALRDINLEELSHHAELLPRNLQKRARHVVSENQRVIRATQALRENDVNELGKLLYESHMSLRHQYEVSCDELDALVDICAECEGVVGARMTGAGFGGCVLCLVQKDAVGEVTSRVDLEYPARTGSRATPHLCVVEDGVTVRRVP